jgi:oligopeptide/dipeptide ABC transporter ATP-binding protein
VTALLDVRELSTVFRLQAGTVRAVNGVSFSINKGRSLAIVGESGCGKSASVLSVMRLVPPPGEVVGGQVLFNGVDLLALPEKDLRAIRGRDIAMIFQDPMTSLNPVLAIGEQLSETLRWHRRMPMAAAREQVIETLALVGIADPAGRLADYPHQFSGGQRQRIMIAMAIVCGPALLIADEPTTALDVTIQAQIVELIAELQSKLGMAVVWITHDLALAGRIVDEVAVMYAGRIVEYGAVDDIFSSPRHPYTAGLLASMPRFDRPGELRLASIDGSPPDLGNLPAGCAFAPRCPRQVERCVAEIPVLEQMGDRRRVACWRMDRS